MPPLRGTPRIWATYLSLTVWGTSTSQTDRQTDRQTDGRLSVATPRLALGASCGKNEIKSKKNATQQNLGLGDIAKSSCVCNDVTSVELLVNRSRTVVRRRATSAVQGCVTSTETVTSATAAAAAAAAGGACV